MARLPVAHRSGICDLPLLQVVQAAIERNANAGQLLLPLPLHQLVVDHLVLNFLEKVKAVVVFLCKALPTQHKELTETRY